MSDKSETSESQQAGDPETTIDSQSHDKPTTEPPKANDTTSPTIDQIPLHVTLKRRLEREGRWAEAEPVRDQLMYHARRQLKLGKDDAREWAYTELDRRFPPPEPEETEPPTSESESESGEHAGEGAGDGEGEGAGDVTIPVGSPPLAIESAPANPARPRGEAIVSGLNILPSDWPQLPANAQLPVEIQWVQSNRLSVVSETVDGTTVDLSQSLSPAPSYAALGWLETSIRAYSKYCEIAAKATQAATDETAVVRREKQSIQQIRDLLAEMLETGDID